MNQTEDKNLTNHEYDGIREYDNKLPNWWVIIFMGTIAFGFLYFIHYNFGGATTQSQELAYELESLPKALEKIWGEDELKEKTSGPESLKMGQAVFASKCSACHGQEGQGVIGPNLADTYWIHGQGQRKDIFQVVHKGAVDKGMPAWEGLLSEEEEVAVTGFIYNLRTTKPANPKAPQGEEYTN